MYLYIKVECFLQVKQISNQDETHIFQNKYENILSLLGFHLIAIERKLAPGD